MLAGRNNKDSSTTVRSCLPSLAVHVPHRFSHSNRKKGSHRSTPYEVDTVALEKQLEGTIVTRKGDPHQICKQSNRSNRKVIDWSQLQCNSNSNRLKFFKCNSNRLKFYLLHLLLSIIFLLQVTLCYFSEGGCRKMIT